MVRPGVDPAPPPELFSVSSVGIPANPLRSGPGEPAPAAASLGRPDPRGLIRPPGTSQIDRRGWILRRVLATADAVAVAAALGAAAWVGVAEDKPTAASGEVVVFAAFVPVWMAIALLSGLYHQDQRRIDYSLVDELLPMFRQVTLWAWLLVLASAAVIDGPTAVMPVLVAWLLMLILVPLCRSIARGVARRTDGYRQRVVMIGDIADADHVERRLRRHPEFGLEVVGRVDLNATDMLGKLHALRPDRLIVVTSPVSFELRTRLLSELLSLHMHVDIVSGDAHVFRSVAVLHELEGLPMLALPPVGKTSAWRGVKRGVDLAIAIPAVLILLPLFAYVAARIRLGSPGGALFRQRRIGHRGKVFELIKFRTMRGAVPDGDLRREAGGDGRVMFKLVDDPRVTKFGVVLRRRSLDELPQLLNVIRGEMSLVGPRPLPIEEAAKVTGPWAARTEVRPGMTGPWQVLGRSDIPFEDMVKLDLNYVANWSISQDLHLLVRTVAAVGTARGAY